jgi:hypothetical protein
MLVDPIRHEFETMQAFIDQGQIWPNATAEEVRGHLRTRYDFSRATPPEEVAAEMPMEASASPQSLLNVAALVLQ